MLHSDDATGIRVWLRSYRYQILLVWFTIVVLAEPFAREGGTGRTVLEAAFCIFLLAAVSAAAEASRWFATALACALIAIALTWSDLIVPADGGSLQAGLMGAQNAIYFAILVAVNVIILRDVMRARRVTFDTICGSVCVYLLMGLCWAILYAMASLIEPESFSAKEELAPHFSTYIYFSYVTLATLGYGDITPQRGVVQTWAWLEAVVGQLYIAVLVARLVGIYIAHELRGDPPRQ